MFVDERVEHSVRLFFGLVADRLEDAFDVLNVTFGFVVVVREPLGEVSLDTTERGEVVASGREVPTRRARAGVPLSDINSSNRLAHEHFENPISRPPFTTAGEFFDTSRD